MKKVLILLVIALCAGFLAACGSDNIKLSCDEPRLYQQATESRRIEAPEGLSDLDPAKEMRVPDAAPIAAREPGSPCLDIPPRYLATDQEDDEDS